MNNINKIVTLSALSAIGVVLMAFIEIPYPLMPFLKIEFSDIVVLIAFALFGFKEGFIVAVIKTLGDLIFQGASGPYAIGQITALIASMSYVGFLFATKLNIEKDGLSKVIMKYMIILCGVAFVMTLANYLFITPIYSGELFWFQMKDGSSLGSDSSYIWAIISTYVPFNLLKGLLTLTIFALIGPRLLSIFNSKYKK